MCISVCHCQEANEPCIMAPALLDLSTQPRDDYLGVDGCIRYYMNGRGITLCQYYWPCAPGAKPRGIMVLTHGHGSYLPFEWLKSQVSGSLLPRTVRLNRWSHFPTESFHKLYCKKRRLVHSALHALTPMLSNFGTQRGKTVSRRHSSPQDVVAHPVAKILSTCRALVNTVFMRDHSCKK